MGRRPSVWERKGETKEQKRILKERRGRASEERGKRNKEKEKRKRKTKTKIKEEQESMKINSLNIILTVGEQIL